MTLAELSLSYQASANALYGRILELRAREQDQADPEEAFRLRQRINTLALLLRETREMASLTAHYYDRSYHRYERYSI